jgi:Zn-dependent protease
MLEGQRDFRSAQEQWLKALPLLPEDSRQALWIQEHVRRLSVTVPEQSPPRSKLGRWLGPLVPLVLALFNLKFIVGFAAFFGIYWSLFGTAFALGFVVQILIHEMGHYIDIKRRGLPADMPVFLPGLGAYVRWNALGVPLRTRAAVSLAGPLAGWMAAAVCALIWFKTGDGVWGALARSGAWLNLLNLIPVWGLDGGHAFLAVTRTQRGVLLVSSLVLLYIVREPVLILIAIGAAFRLFTRDSPEESSLATVSYFAAVLCGLTGLMWLLPGQGFGSP